MKQQIVIKNENWIKKPFVFVIATKYLLFYNCSAVTVMSNEKALKFTFLKNFGKIYKILQ